MDAAEAASVDAGIATNKADLVGGKIVTSQLPGITIGESFPAASQAAMLALTAQIGDVAIRTDLSNAKYLLLGTPATTLANWVVMGVSGGAVDSVNSLTGAVVLAKSNIGLGSVDNTSDAAKPVSTATQTALNAKQVLDADLTTIAALNSATSGVIASDGAGWISKTYAQIKTALSLVKADVGLGSVDNTSDMAKPVSTATQTALNLKADVTGLASVINAKLAPYSAVGDDSNDDTAELQAAINAAIAADVPLYVPKGTYKISAGLVANSTSFRMYGAGAGKTIIKSTASTFDLLWIGPSSESARIVPNGWIKDLSIVGPAAAPSGGYAALKLSSVIQYEVNAVAVDNADIGFDLVNNCYGSMLYNCRAGFGGTVNVALNLRTGVQSGSDLNFHNCWLMARKAAVHISGDGGGFHFYGGQMSAGIGLSATDDNLGVIILGKDYISGVTGTTTHVTVDNVDIEGWQYIWAIRAFDQHYISSRNSSYPSTQTGANKPLGIYKATNAKSSLVTLHDHRVSGSFATALFSVAGAYDNYSVSETGFSIGPNNDVIVNGVTKNIANEVGITSIAGVGSVTTGTYRNIATAKACIYLGGLHLINDAGVLKKSTDGTAFTAV